MASYQDRLGRKKKWYNLKFNIMLGLSLYWENLARKTSTNKYFHEVIVNDIHNALENGAKEIRYYKYSGNELYESLEDEFKVFKEEQEAKGAFVYSILYSDVAGFVQTEFEKYKEDIEFTFVNGFDNPYFSVKALF